MEKLKNENIEVIMMGMTFKNAAQSGLQANDGLVNHAGIVETKKRPFYRGLKYRTEQQQQRMIQIARAFGEIGSEELDLLQVYFYPMLKNLPTRSRNLLIKTLRSNNLQDRETLKKIIDPQFFMDITRRHSLDRVKDIVRLIFQLYENLKNKNASKSAIAVQLLQCLIPFEMESLDKYLNGKKQLMVFHYLKDAFENSPKFSVNEKNVLKNYFMTEDNLTLRDMGELLGVSFERIRQIKEKLSEILSNVAVVMADKADCLPKYYRKNGILALDDYAEMMNRAEGVCFNSKLYEMFIKEQTMQSGPFA